jgi:hypothetical protein
MANYFGIHTVTATKASSAAVDVEWVETGLSFEVMEIQYCKTDLDADYVRVVAQAQGVNQKLAHTGLTGTVQYYRLRCRNNKGRWSDWIKVNADIS